MLRPPSPPHLSLTLTAPALFPPPPLHSNVQHGRVFPFVLIRGVRTGPNATRSLVLHLYSPALVGSTSHSNMGCSLAVRCEARGSPCGTNYYTMLAPPYGSRLRGGELSICGSFGLIMLARAEDQNHDFHDDDFDDFVVDSIVLFPPLFPTGTQDLAFVVGGDDGFSCFSCCGFLRRRLTASKASSTTTTTTTIGRCANFVL